MNTLIEFKGQTVIIAGAGSGIGRAIIELIHSLNGNVIALDNDKILLEKIGVDLKLNSNQLRLVDVTKENQLRDEFAEIVIEFGRIDALINSVGITGITSKVVEDLTTTEIDSVLQVNLFGAIWMTQAVLPIMKSQKYGRIVHLASIAGKEGNPKMAPYNISKAGLIGFVKGVAKENAESGITVNAIAPAVVSTPMNLATSPETLAYMISKIPVGRLGEPAEIAHLAAFVASKSCSFTTGFVFDASGGRATY